MVQSYAQSVQNLKAGVIDQNVKLRQDQVSHATQESLNSAINRYVDQKVSEGYAQNPDGSLEKSQGNVTTRIIIDKQTGSVDIKTITTTPASTQTTGVYEQLESKIRQTERALKNLQNQGSPGASSVQAYLNALYDQRDKLANTGSMFQTIPASTQESSAQENIVFDIKGQGYSVAPALQSSFLSQTNNAYPFISQVQNKSPGSLYAPRVVNESETSAVPLKLDLSQVNAQKTSGVINARKPGDFAPYNERVSPYDLKATQLISDIQNVNQPLQNLGVFGIGVGAGFMKESHEVATHPVKALELAGTGVALALVPEVFAPALAIVGAGTIVNDLGQSSSVFNAGERSGAIVENVGIMSIGSSALKIPEINPFSKSDVLGSSYNLASESEKIPIFLQREQINPSGSGGPEFNPIRSATNPSGVFNLAGVEQPAPNPPGILPLELKQTFDTQPTQLKLLEDTQYFKIKNGQFIPSENVPANPFNDQLSRARSETGFRSEIFDLRLNKFDAKIQTEGSFIPQENGVGGSQRDLFGNKILGSAKEETPLNPPSDQVPSTQFELPKTKDVFTLTSKGLEKQASITQINPAVAKNPLPLEDLAPKNILSKETQSTLPVRKSLDVFDLQINPETKQVEVSKVMEIQGLSHAPKDQIIGSQTPVRSETPKESVSGKQALNFQEAKNVGKSESSSQSSGPIVFPGKNIPGPESKVVLSPDYVLDQGSGYYVRVVNGQELGLDIKGKVTPEFIGVRSPVLSLGLNQQNLQSPARIQSPQISLNQDQGLFQQQQPSQEQRTNQGQRQGQTQIQLLQTKTTTTPGSRSETNQRDQINFERVNPKFNPGSPQENTEKNPPAPKLFQNKQSPSGHGQFTLLVRKQGKFVKIGSGFSDLATAINRGKQEIRNTASASFKITNFFGGEERININNDKTLTRSKVDQNVVVQKRSFRISSPGEVNEISRKGVFAQKTRKGLNKNKNIFR